MEGTITVQMTVEEYNRIQKIEDLLSQMVAKAEKLKNENDILKFQLEQKKEILVNVSINLLSLGHNNPNRTVLSVVPTGPVLSDLDYDKIASEIKNRVQSIEYIAREFQKTKQELNRIPKWVRRIFK